jgi:hypothetical protein
VLAQRRVRLRAIPLVETNMTLGEKQRKFTLLAANLIQEAYRLGYQVTFGEAYRPPEVAERYAIEGRGIANSLHTSRLAIDLNLFRDGKYLTISNDYLPLGEFWETLGGSWGGRFSKPDGNHFSLEHNGVR